MKKLNGRGAVRRDPADDLSAVNSHRRDHERIVALADAVLNRGEGIIRKKDIDAFASAIARHTENFDALYVDAATTRRALRRPGLRGGGGVTLGPSVCDMSVAALTS